MWWNIIIIVVALLFGLANLFLAVYVYIKNPKARVNRDFFYFGFAIFLWCAANFAYLLAQNLFWLRATYAVGSIVPLVGIFFTYALVDKKMNKWLKIFIITIGSAFFAIYLFSPLLVENQISFSDFEFKANYGLLLNLWRVQLVSMILAAVYIAIHAMKEIDEQKRKQVSYFLTGAMTWAIWAVFVTVVLPYFGFTQLNNFDWPAAILLVGFTSSAIIKYHLMNISSLLFQAFIYSLVIVIIIALLVLLMFTGSFLFARAMIWPVYAIAFVVAVVLFFIGRLFFVEKRDLEKAKINLTKMLETSEKNRIKTVMERDRTKTIVNNFSDGLIILDGNDKFFSINPEAVKTLELDVNKLLGKSFQSLADFPRAEPIVSALKTGVNYTYRKEVELTKNFVIELSVISLNSGSRDIGHLIVIHDVSREKIVEKMKTEFVSLAAHQLRTPLSIIKWTMSMLRKGDFGKLTGKQNQLIERTFQNNERLITLVNDLLNVTRIEEGKYLYKIALADIREIVKFVLDSHKERIKNKKIKIEFQEPESIPQLMLDSEKIKLVVQNLVDNAIEYSLAGGKIIVTLGSDARNVEVRVQDFGMGIPKNQQDKIFTKFFRGDNAAKVNTAGTGLGLFLSKNIVEAHGGIMWFKSEENVGTTFFFTLPIKRA